MVPNNARAVASKEMLLSKVRRRRAHQKVRFGTLLVAAKVATQAQVDDALAAQGQRRMRLGEMLVSMGVLSEPRLNAILDHQFGPICVDIARYPVNDAALALLPAKFARKLGVLPVEVEDGVLYFASEQELPESDVRLIAYTAGIRQAYRLQPTAPDQLAVQISRKYTHQDSIVFATERGAGPADQVEQDQPEVSLRAMLAHAIAHAASDIHIALRTTQPTSIIKLRVDGTLIKFCELSTAGCKRLIRQLENFAGMGFRRPGEAREGRLSFHADEALINLRISIMPSAIGDSVVLRVLDARNFKADIGGLYLPANQAVMLRALIEKPHGLLLMTGPTGSGKTSTLYTILKHIQGAGSRHIATVEDPVEYILPGITQFSTNNFAHSLKLLLRHDPDVIMVGEMRDADSGLAAVNAAITGHFVMGTLHANDSVSAVHRLLSLGVPAVLIASSLCGVLSQRLVRLSCMTCRGAGCNACRNTGYAGRRLVAELIRPKRSFATMLTQSSTCEDIRQHVEFIGLDLDRALIAEGQSGATDWREVRALVGDPALLPADAMPG
jgi:type IV pilus assembly protein PilB